MTIESMNHFTVLSSDLENQSFLYQHSGAH